MSVGANVNRNGCNAVAKVGRTTVASVPVSGKAAPPKVLPKVKPIPAKPVGAGCYGVKQIVKPTTVSRNETNESLKEKMKTVLGHHVGESTWCVALVKVMCSVGPTHQWKRGQKVQGNVDIKPGTPIATFGPTGKYENKTNGSSHAAIFSRFVKDGIEVYDQWPKRAAYHRVIVYRNGNGTANNDASQYHVITK